MSLLQISEPGQSPNPHEFRLAVGIDLGTTNSLVATVRHGSPECLADADGAVLLPSVVQYLENDGKRVGAQALTAYVDDPSNTIVSAKRWMGRTRSDIATEDLPYRFTEDPKVVSISTRSGVKNPVQVAADILQNLVQRAEARFDAEVYGAVVTVPAYFDDAQRQATKDAAQLAGLKVLRLINEPTAAAIAYGLDHGSEGVYAVYDLGGGTFDISILRLSKGVFEVIATGGDSALGGDDYEQALLQHLGLPATPAARVMARQLKEALSQADSVEYMPLSQEGQKQEGQALRVLTRAEFEAATAELTQRTLQVVKKTLRDAKLKTTEIQGVVLVGGATRMPQIQNAVATFFGTPPLNDLNPDEVVALGAAVSANQLAGNNSNDDLLLLDVTPLSLGVETMGGLVERIIPRNQTIPTAMAQNFTTFKDGQTAMQLHVVQGERDLVADCRSLARFELHGIPPMAAGVARIRVTFSVDVDGLLEVSAQELSSGVQAQVTVKPSYGLGEEQITQMLQDGFGAAALDKEARALAEAKLEGERLLYATQTALAADADLLDTTDTLNIAQAMQDLQAQLKTDSVAAIEAANKALASATEGFAAARMNEGIRRSLTGKTLDQI